MTWRDLLEGDSEEAIRFQASLQRCDNKTRAKIMERLTPKIDKRISAFSNLQNQPIQVNVNVENYSREHLLERCRSGLSSSLGKAV